MARFPASLATLKNSTADVVQNLLTFEVFPFKLLAHLSCSLRPHRRPEHAPDQQAAQSSGTGGAGMSGMLSRTCCLLDGVAGRGAPLAPHFGMS